MPEQLTVRSHVSRDLLQTAGLFKNERLVVWEYVSNELEYVDPGVSPVVKVVLDGRNKKITVSGNGRGMEWGGAAGLGHFFLMHGENPDRKAGRPGRGVFGTGKSAAFGIGDTLRITTVRNGKRSVVELDRKDLETADGGDAVPVRTIEREAATSQANGTLVEIEGIHLRALDQAGVVKYIERHLAHWPRDVSVIVNNHECEFQEPPIERTVESAPDAALEQKLGAVTLTLKVSKSPLDDDLRGVSISANGVWHETTLLSSAGKEMSEYIFGDLDVPALAADKTAPPAFDASRSMRLNPDNELVQAIFTFVGPHIEELRRELVEKHREHRETEEAKRLRQEADKIADIINSDFDEFRRRLQKVKAATPGPGGDASKAQRPGGQEAGDDFLLGGDDPAVEISPDGETGRHGPSKPEPSAATTTTPPRLNPILAADPAGEATGRHSGTGDDTPRRRGGFSIEFDEQGEDASRATYQPEKRTIYINLDHPQISAAKHNRTPEDPTFRRLAYEVAFSEYAVALASELNNRGEYVDPTDPIVDIRDTINRIARQAAPLYS